MSEETTTCGGLEVLSVELARADSETMSASSDALNNVVFELPDTPEGLKEDPRTGLSLICVPPELRQVMGIAFSGDPLLHFVGIAEKMSGRQAFSRRILAISSYCIYVLYTTGGLARALQVADIKRLWVSNTDRSVFAFLVPTEFDLVLRSPDAPAILEIIKTIFRYKKKKDLPMADMSAEMIMSSARAVKPAHWRPEMMYVHSRAQLYRRLQQHNERDVFLEYLHMDRDPRTQLELLGLPRPFHHLFRSSLFAADREPLLHFFSPCEQLNHKASSEKRFCLISNSCVYVYSRSAKVERCLPVSTIDRVEVRDKLLAALVPQEHDLLLEFPEPEGPQAVAKVCGAIFKLKCGADLPVGDVIDPTALRLKPPHGWKPTRRPVLTRRQLVDHLQASGIKPDAPAVIVGADGLEPT
eukprot:GGOE01003157.1.p1 GENE.GGOE01003157.1~~GGOE01003157.1.p1  ORF type:complete len:477 (-),score=130.28 GGOE01003157.1:535-1773(-)